MTDLRRTLIDGCRSSPGRRLAAVWLVGLFIACGAHRGPIASLRVETCREVVPEPEPQLRWIAPAAEADRRALTDWCATVGPILYHRRPSVDAPPVADRLAIVTWNVHVGAGDVGELIRRLQAGAYTGEPVRHFVLLLQETYRRDGGVPPQPAHGLPTPRRIGSHDDNGRRADIDHMARQQRVAVLYVPSMRNGGESDRPEDRGNAIVSTLPLQSPVVIELPLEHQRRVVAAALIEGQTSSGVPWRLRVADAHLDTALALTRGGPLRARRRQATAIIDALSATADDTVIGGDLNSWLGSHEPALRALREVFPDAGDQSHATWKGPLGLRANLDHLLFRGRAHLSRVVRLPDRFGSDHYPVLGVLRF
jgi:endonuclease/exonuclease/phosphatase family metal-dependent hydrolase